MAFLHAEFRALQLLIRYFKHDTGKTLMNTTCRILLVLSFLPLVASAHHSRMEFSRNEIREIEGEVVSVFWCNPHVHVRVRTQDGALWDLEGGPTS